jgi:predicted secreted hydrolase
VRASRTRSGLLQGQGRARASTATEMQAGMIGLASGDRTPVQCDLEMDTVMPPWIAGSFSEDLPGAATALRFEGVPRNEQLYRVQGALRVDGQEWSISGTGLRTHRYGTRDVTGIAGHSWLSAVFPDGAAFGVKRFPTADGGLLSSEGWTAAPGAPLVGAKSSAPPG